MVNLSRYVPARVQTFYNNNKSAIDRSVATAAVIAVLVGGGYGHHRRVQAVAEAARQEERQKADAEKKALQDQMAARQRAAGRRTGIMALFGVGRYPADYSTADMLSAGYSGRVNSIDENGDVTQHEAGWDAKVGGAVDSTARTPTRLLRRGTKDVPVLRYFTAVLDGAWGAITGILPDFLTGGDSAARGKGSVKPGSYGSKPAVNDVDPASRELGVVKMIGASFRGWQVRRLFDNNGGEEGGNGGLGDDEDLNEILNGGDHVRN